MTSDTKSQRALGSIQIKEIGVFVPRWITTGGSQNDKNSFICVYCHFAKSRCTCSASPDYLCDWFPSACFDCGSPCNRQSATPDLCLDLWPEARCKPTIGQQAVITLVHYLQNHSAHKLQ